MGASELNVAVTLWWTSIPFRGGGIEILLLALCYGNRPDGPLGSYADFTFTLHQIIPALFVPQETEASSLIYTTGCIESLTNWINNNLHIVGGLAFGLAVIQVRGRSFLFMCSWRLVQMSLCTKPLLWRCFKPVRLFSCKFSYEKVYKKTRRRVLNRGKRSLAIHSWTPLLRTLRGH